MLQLVLTKSMQADLKITKEMAKRDTSDSLFKDLKIQEVSDIQKIKHEIQQSIDKKIDNAKKAMVQRYKPASLID